MAPATRFVALALVLVLLAGCAGPGEEPANQTDTTIGLSPTTDGILTDTQTTDTTAATTGTELNETTTGTELNETTTGTELNETTTAEATT
jgi:hypothetical protein